MLTFRFSFLALMIIGFMLFGLAWSTRSRGFGCRSIDLIRSIMFGEIGEGFFKKKKIDRCLKFKLF